MGFRRMIWNSSITIGMLGLVIPASANDRTSVDHNTSQTSTAQVHISDGRLSLDSIPSFRFTNIGSPDQYRLHLVPDANSSDDRAQVTDYRNADLPSNDPKSRPGWSLSVSAQIPDGFRLGLSHRDAHSSLSSRSVILDHDHPTQEVMGSNVPSPTNPRQGYGIHSVYFNHADDAYLNIPDTSPKDYTLNVSWELNSQINSDVNDVY